MIPIVVVSPKKVVVKLVRTFLPFPMSEFFTNIIIPIINSALKSLCLAVCNKCAHVIDRKTFVHLFSVSSW